MTTDISVLIPGKIHPRILERLEGRFRIVRAGREEVERLDDDTRKAIRAVAVFNDMPADLIDALPNLEIIGSFGVGYDGVDVQRAVERGIMVTHTPDVLNDEVADTAIGLLLNTIRRLPQAENFLREGRWGRGEAFPLSPLSLSGRSVGLYGLGRIGLEIARRLEAFKLGIGYHTRSPRSDVSYRHYASLKEMAQAVDILICIVPKTPETHKAIDAGILEALGPDGVLINVGRGWSVDEAALIAALENGTIAGAGLDVYYDEPHVPEALLGFDSVSLLPHVASASVPTRNAMADLVADNLIDWFSTGRARTPVPETP